MPGPVGGVQARRPFDFRAMTATSQTEAGSAPTAPLPLAGVRIIDPPETPIVPSAPNRPLLLSIVLVAGIGAGIAVALFLAQMEDCFGTIQSLRNAFTLPVLGSISISTIVIRIDRLRFAVFSVLSLFPVFLLRLRL